MSLCIYQIRNDLQKGFQQHDESTSQTLIKYEQRVNTIRVDLNLLEEQMTQRMAHVSLNDHLFFDDINRRRNVYSYR
jgi:hypothetical protein